jgi:L-rhamnose isomerase/sugar isomerase
VREAGDLGIRIGAINPNLFQDDDYRLGSLCHPDGAIRQRAVDHMLECVGIARDVGSEIVSLWLADGTNYAGQDDIRARRRRLIGCLEEVYAQLPAGMRLLIEYKFFEPGFYHTDLNDWGAAYAISLRLGPQAQVLVDTGHHAQGTNIEHLVATLLEEGRLGGFHFNSRRYADDDLIVGSANPFELFCILQVLVGAGRDLATAAWARQVAYMIDQSHNIEPKLEAMVQSVVNLQQAHARALLVDTKRLEEAQQAGDVLEAHRVLLDAYDTDPRPLLAEHRRRRGLDPDPIAALRRSGRPDLLARQRGTRAVMAGGYPG